LLPSQLLNAYNATPLTEAGYTGRGTTVVVFSFDGFDQEDMDGFADIFGLPRFTPQVVGGMPAQRSGESTMDLQMVHAVAPDAKLVMVNVRSTVEGDRAFQRLAELMESVDRDFPGAIWSFSIGWGCDRLFTEADLAPVRSALVRAQANGTTAFIASGSFAEHAGRHWQPPSPWTITCRYAYAASHASTICLPDRRGSCRAAMCQRGIRRLASAACCGSWT
jgi:kumamolisin